VSAVLLGCLSTLLVQLHAPCHPQLLAPGPASCQLPPGVQANGPAKRSLACLMGSLLASEAAAKQLLSSGGGAPSASTARDDDDAEDVPTSSGRDQQLEQQQEPGQGREPLLAAGLPVGAALCATLADMVPDATFAVDSVQQQGPPAAGAMRTGSCARAAADSLSAGHWLQGEGLAWLLACLPWMHAAAAPTLRRQACPSPRASRACHPPPGTAGTRQLAAAAAALSTANANATTSAGLAAMLGLSQPGADGAGDDVVVLVALQNLLSYSGAAKGAAVDIGLHQASRWRCGGVLLTHDERGVADMKGCALLESCVDGHWILPARRPPGPQRACRPLAPRD